MMTATELVNTVRQARAKLEGVLARIPPEQWDQPLLSNDWSVNDVLSHITAWEERLLAWWDTALVGAVPEEPARGWTEETITAANEAIYRAHRGKPTAEVLTAFRRSYERLLDMLETAPMEALLEPGYWPWARGYAFADFVLANTADHYRDHLADLQTLIPRRDDSAMDLRQALRITRGAVVTFTGAGGKTTAMLRLGRELAAAGLRVAATTTTRLGLDELDRFPHVLFAPTPATLAAALRETPFVLAVAGRAPAEGKALGLESEQAAALGEVADVVLVEGDGSRRLPLKAPGPGEPVVPPTTTHLVCCIGLAALGRPLDETTVHRPERVAALSGLPLGATITPAALARLLLHPDGPGRGAPPTARRYLLVNGADSAPTTAALEGLWLRLAASPAWEAVLTAQVAKEPPVLAAYGHLSAVVLAAGGSVRFGAPKQLALWQGQPLLRHVVLQVLAAPVQEIVVVLGAHYEETAAVLAGLPVTLVYNPDWEAGQSTSVRAGLRACAPQTQAALFIL
ncbi:MAG: selenium cofactor biosynthesis protein YqeC, partial [Anaerolineae bacterium]|nr:selenium cofactor biosynthesis protein YqeC [Caldilineales bacterium]MDW8267842.1 selenium cofactor biosynthesis protein YqeC [Anaerolineae bacterium]